MYYGTFKKIKEKFYLPLQLDGGSIGVKLKSLLFDTST
jgi:hypothetical protein